MNEVLRDRSHVPEAQSSRSLLHQESSSVDLDNLIGQSQTRSREETLALRREIIPTACALHFEKSPMKVSYARGQYLYDDLGVEYLDCVNCVAHVGHCHSLVVKAGTEAMIKTGSVAAFDKSNLVEAYIDTLRKTLPPGFDTFLFVTSASEANDLALRIARLYTGGAEIVAVERSFHGSVTLPNSISPRIHINQSSSQIPDWVHVLPCPDLYRGKYREDDDASAVDKYCADARAIIERLAEDGDRKIACLILESVMSIAGIIIPPSKWVQFIYEEVRKAGGLVIADEAQTGMGRCGTCWWSFQFQDVLPDIVTIGKPLGNGHPMAVVATKRSIAACLGPNQLQFYTCDNVSAAIGAAIFKVLRQENLLHHACKVGSFLLQGLKSLAKDHRYIGDVRGIGLMLGVEIVFSKETRKPAKDIAEKICYMMKDNRIILGNDGIHKNVLIVMPPMVFTCENAHHLIRTLSKVLGVIEAEDDPEWADQGQRSGSTLNATFGYMSEASQGSTDSSRRLFQDSERISLDDIELHTGRRSGFTEMD